MPMPSPKDVPVGAWFNGTQTTSPTPQWIVDGQDIVFIWRSPIFDMRPDLRNLPGGNPGPRRDATLTAVPMWAKGASLYVQIYNLDAVNPATNLATNRTDMKFSLSERANIKFPGDMKQVVPRTDISQYLDTQVDCAILTFTPAGGNRPFRFWNIEIEIRRENNAVTGLGASNPPLVIDAGMY
jgi:hypothetical protein